MNCTLCPRNCGVERATQQGYCGASALPCVARAALHFWEEPYISGSRGSGAIFFCGCNLSCLFCQNYEINHSEIGTPMSAEELAGTMLLLQKQGAHNINLVTPSPHTIVIAEAIRAAKGRGLHIPIVYNTNAYEKAETLERLAGLVDIYLPDLKYTTGLIAEKYSGAKDYFVYANLAICEMKRQVGDIVLDSDNLAVSGLAVRHLVLPGSLDETRRVLDYIADNLGTQTYLSLLGQYLPCHRADFPPLNRPLLQREYDRAVDYCIMKGFRNVLLQELSSANKSYTPPFDGTLPEEYE